MEIVRKNVTLVSKQLHSANKGPQPQHFRKILHLDSHNEKHSLPSLNKAA